MLHPAIKMPLVFDHLRFFEGHRACVDLDGGQALVQAMGNLSRSQNTKPTADILALDRLGGHIHLANPFGIIDHSRAGHVIVL